LALRAYRQNYGIGYVILRLFNVLGTGNRGVIDSYVQAAVTGKSIHGFGRDQLRDFVDAGDVAEAFRLAATQSDVVDKIINIGSGQGIRISELAAMIAKAVPGTQIEFEEKPDFIPYHAVADVTLARKLLARPALGLRGERVAVPSFTFNATGLACYWTGNELNYVGVDETLTVDPKLLATLRGKVDFLLPVHLYGNPCDVDALRDWGAKE